MFENQIGREKRNNFERLQDYMAEISARINERALNEFGIADLVDEKGCIDLDGFGGENGIYSTEKIASDKEKVFAQEIRNSSAENENVQKFYGEEFGANTKQEIVEKWREKKEKSMPSQLEMVVTAILHKVLKNDFVVARASSYDDYFGHADNLIVDLKTGQVLCAFDEVRDNKNSDRRAGKIEKIEKIAQEGGTTIEYGLTAESGRLKRARLEKVPVFFLDMTSEELDSALAGMNYNADEPPTAEEKRIFIKLVMSLAKQKKALQYVSGAEETVLRLERTLARIEEYIRQNG